MQMAVCAICILFLILLLARSAGFIRAERAILNFYERFSTFMSDSQLL
jgi:hypothetical protein